MHFISAKKLIQIGLILFGFFLSRVGFSQDTIISDGYQKFYFTNGKISSEGTLKNGKPDGYWKSYNQNGTLKSEGNRKNFELDSLWKFYNEEGNLLLEINYQKGKKNGIKTTYLEKEIIREVFINDIKEGYTRYYFKDGKLKQEVPFVKGQEQGFGKEFDEEGMIITLTEYKKGFIVDRMRINRKDANGRRIGKWFTFFENGNIKTEVSYKNDLKNGYYKEYAENGDLVKILKYLDGVVQEEALEIQKLEVQNEYFPNGKVKISAMFRNGVPEGIMRQYDSAGVVEKSFLYRNGLIVGEGIVKDDGNRHGPWKEFYPDGSLKAEGKYENGKPTGEWKFYYSNGKMEQTGRYNKAGKPDGLWKWYFEDGQLQREENYRAGLKDGLSTTYDEKGTIIEEGEFIDGNEDGAWIEQIGDTYTKGAYRDGLRNGLWTYYYLENRDNGTDSLCFFRGNFIEDYPDGKHVYYYENGKTKTEGSYVMGKREGDWYLYNEDGTLFLVITYKNGIETRYDGVKIKPAYENEEE
jgi:antitoxin component YwqK of YwqJK toxin-antitoxin module